VKIVTTPPPFTPEDIAQADDIDLNELEEKWNVYKLKDGTTLKVELVLTGVKRLKKHNSDGSPIYLINTQNAVRVADVPKELIAKPKEPLFKPV
jgi:hypothetical protein